MLKHLIWIFIVAAAFSAFAQDDHKGHNHDGHDHAHDHNKEYVPAPTHKAVAIPVEVLADYVGVYYWAPHRTTIAITLEGKDLYGQPKTKPKSKLMPMDNETFFIEGVGAELTFVRDDEGKVIKMMLLEDNDLQEAIRLDEEDLAEENKKDGEKKDS